ncbi:MAG: response regulator [Phycisphaerales bacterium]|nr:MAG: response regulator [Phycisphaerales bacterium]
MARVLVVDDEPMYRENLQEVIAEEGHDVQVADNGHKAIEIAGRFCPDVLIVDWMLRNDICGLEVSKFLRESNPHLITIIITGYPTQDLRTQAEEAKVFAFLEKPFELGDIRDAVRKATQVGTGKE